MYTLEEKAIKLVVKAFEGQKRRKEDINLAFHSISVGFMLKDLGCSEEIVVSGFLHDIIEDTSYDYEYLAQEFGSIIASNVKNVSENKEIEDWIERKKEFFSRIERESDDIILIEVADKLHNLLSDYPLWQENGSDALATLSTTYEMNKWYYLEMQKLFNSRLNNNKLLSRYNEICRKYFGE